MGAGVTNRKPRFLWQGLLIVLPVILLAAVGFISLRQDRLLAESEATERAKGIAGEFANELKSKLDALAKPSELAGRCFKLDAAGRLVFPPPAEPVPAPRPFDPGSLGTEQAKLWFAAQKSESDNNDPAKALAAWNTFLDSKPPSNFVAEARYVSGLLLLKSGARQEAASRFQSLCDEYPDAVGESGLPLQPLAQLKLLDLMGDTSGSLSSFEVLCSNLVCQPTLLTPRLLRTSFEMAKTSVDKEAVGRWQRAWLRQQLSRELFAAAAPQIRMTPNAVLTAFWFSAAPFSESDIPELGYAKLPMGLEEHNWLAIPQPESSTNCWFVCLGEGQLGILVSQLAHVKKNIPDYFGVRVEVEGKNLSLLAPELRLWHMAHYLGSKGLGQEEKEFSSQLATKVLASASEGVLGQGQVKVAVYLTSPSALFQRQRVRSFWFGALIAASAFAALIGLLAAYRSFRRQLRLSELKSNFVSSVSHELRAPIASVRLMAESLERGKISEAPKQREYFSFIVQECRRLSSLIENVLDFSRIEQGRKQYDLEPTDLVALTEKTVALMQTYAAERQVNLTLSLDALSDNGKPQPLADGKALQQALINLIDNALKHSPKGSTITVGLEMQERPGAESQPVEGVPAKNARDLPSRRVLLLWVEDHGPGIPKEEHQRIFERFYRLGSELRRETPGVGIGLSIVKHIVESHGGRVVVRSAVGEGSRFTLELPMNENGYGTHPNY